MLVSLVPRSQSSVWECRNLTVGDLGTRLPLRDTNMAAGNRKKTSGVYFCQKRVFFFPCEFSNVKINISPQI